MTRTHGLPGGGTTLEVTECLGELQWLDDDALLLLVVAQLGVTSQGEILAQRVTIETVVSHDTAQIRVSGEEDTEHVVDFTLVPQGTLKEAGDTGDGGSLVRVGLDTDARVVADTEEVVNDLEALVAGGEVDTSDIGDLGELGGSVVLQEAHHRDDTSGGSVYGEFILPHGELLDVLGQAGHDVLSVGVEVVRHGLVLVSRVDDGGTQGSGG